MPSTFRIPKAELTGLRGRLYQAYSRRLLGQVADGLYVYFHDPQVLSSVMKFEGKVAKWDALDPDLKNFAQMASAAVIGCSWCMDYGYFAAHCAHHAEAKLREVPRWPESDAFTDVCELPLAWPLSTVTPVSERIGS